MPLKRYVCTVHPNLRIGATIKFNDGFYQTDSQYQQATIEKNDCWDWGIKEIPLIEDVQNQPAPVIPEMDDAVMSQDDDGLEVEPVNDPEPAPKPELTPHEEKLAEVREKPITGLTATDISVMKKADLEGLVQELGAVIPEDRKPTVAVLKRVIRRKLGV